MSIALLFQVFRILTKKLYCYIWLALSFRVLVIMIMVSLRALTQIIPIFSLVPLQLKEMSPVF